MAIEPVKTAPPAEQPVTIAGADVTVNIRPWGYLAVDKGERSTDELQQHRVKLPPGKHALTVGCNVGCDPAGKTITVTVEAGKENTFNLPAPLKTSLVSFMGFPDEATARVGAETRTVAESRVTPFLVKMPPEGLMTLRHQVHWEVTLGGETLGRGTAEVNAGDNFIIKKDAP
jgi:hypothetical protein